MSKAMPVKLSGELIEEARTASVALHRSLTSQIEHWATIGRIAEAHLSGDVLRSLVSESGGTLQISQSRDKSARRKISKALAAFLTQPDDNAWLREIAASGVAIYGNEPGKPVTRFDPSLSVAAEASARDVASAAG